MCKYEVKCKCGHVGRKNYIVISFPVVAEHGREAAYKARYFPRVKHDHKDAIISVRKITDEEYGELIAINSQDEYLQCSNRQEQNLLDLSNRLIKEERLVKSDKTVVVEHKQCFFGKVLIKKPKKYFKNIFINDYNTEAYAW